MHHADGMKALQLCTQHKQVGSSCPAHSGACPCVHVEAKSYLPNDYNLFNMAGNVAEWTSSSYDSGAYEYVASLNPNMSLQAESRKVVRGGSWKDVAYFLRVSSRDYEYSDTARSYIGFRTVQDYLGTSKVKIK